MRFSFPSILTFAAALLLAPLSPPAADAASQVSVPRQVLAYYYGWWGNPAHSGRWTHWLSVNPSAHTIANSRWYPTDGAYDSHDAAELEKQATEAAAAGVTGFVYSWWGPGSFPDQGLPLLLQTAARHNMKIAVAIEQLLGTTPAQNQRNAQTFVDYVLRSYAAHPAYLKVNGQPVLFLNVVSLNQVQLPVWRAILAQAVKDTGITPFIAADTNLRLNALTTANAVYSYDLEHKQTAKLSLPQIQNWATRFYPPAMASMGDRISIATILPGHDASELSWRPQASQLITQRYNGATYATLWPAAIGANPDWILIVSWNEWHEGSQIEPSYQFGTQALDTNAIYARQFLALPPKSHAM